MATEDLANKKEKLNATNESLNKSKGKKSVQEMVETREAREAELRKQNERANQKFLGVHGDNRDTLCANSIA